MFWFSLKIEHLATSDEAWNCKQMGDVQKGENMVNIDMVRDLIVSDVDDKSSHQ